MDELRSHVGNNTWTLVPRASLPKGTKVIGTKVVLKLKRDADGQPERYKARVVSVGFQQKEGMDYDEVFAPTAQLTTIRVLHACSCRCAWLAVLPVRYQKQPSCVVGYLRERMYMCVFIEPPLFVNVERKDVVCKLNRTTYGLKSTGPTHVVPQAIAEFCDGHD